MPIKVAGVRCPRANRDARERMPRTEEHKKAWGQFFTSPAIAAFMASLLREPGRREVRVLDAGAGMGVLGLAAAEALIAKYGARVHLVAVEKEPGALSALREAAVAARTRLGASSLHVEIVADDFLDQDRPRLGCAALASFAAFTGSAGSLP